MFLSDKDLQMGILLVLILSIRRIFGIINNYAMRYLQISHFGWLLSIVSFVSLFVFFYRRTHFSRVRSIVSAIYGMFLLQMVWFGRHQYFEAQIFSIKLLFGTYLQLASGPFVFVIINIILNIILFIPTGIILNKIGFHSKLHVACIAIGMCLMIEIVQLLLGIGTFEVCDLIDNGLGIIIGLEISNIKKKCMISKDIYLDRGKS